MKTLLFHFNKKFIKEAFKVAVEFLSEDLNLNTRTAALYLLYSLHCNQNESIKQNVRAFFLHFDYN